ncbi:hypothetical protein [Adhaeribacter aquaticus]|uniref:hypothetical protein n=1 Tax=Adhaeribacter aquaticus TaxID=299567 RepID=UPI0004128321|nr:hypothetical protein [Adhaeribacter aquaticus]
MNYLSNVIRFLFCLGFFSGTALVVAAQSISQPHRIEIEDEDSNPIEVLPLPDSTFLIYKRPYFSFKKEHSFQKYSKDFKLVWSQKVELENRLEFYQFFPGPDFVYALYKHSNSSEFSILKIDPKTGTNILNSYNLRQHDIKYEVDLESFQILENHIFITAKSSVNSFVIHLDEINNELKTIPALYGPLNTLVDFHLDTLTRRAEFILAESKSNIGRLQVKRFNSQGNLFTSNFIRPVERQSLITAKISPGDSTRKVIIGAYSLRDSRFAQGLFSTTLNNLETIRYYDFIQLKHFFDFMRKKSRERLFTKAQKYAAKNKTFRQQYQLLIHDAIWHGEKLYLVGEVYNQRSTTYRSLYNYRSSAILARARWRPDLLENAYRTNPGYNRNYKYSHSLVCVFDKDGNYLWDNSLVIKDVEDDELIPVSQFGFYQDKTIMAYAYEKEIRYKIVNQDSTSEEALVEPLRTNAPDEKITSADNTTLLHWYGPHFIAFGYHYIRSPRSSNKRIFFINKVSFK